MSCSRWTEAMSLRLDGRLTQDQESALDEHLRSCQPCRQQWEAMQWASSLLETEPAAEPLSGFTVTIQNVLWQRELYHQRVVGALKVCLGSVVAWGTAAATAVVTMATLEKPVRTLAVDLGVPFVTDAISFARMFAWAGLSGLKALCTTSTVAAVFGYIALAVALTATWILVVARFRSRIASDSD